MIYNFNNEFFNLLNQLKKTNNKFVLGLSGGVDSMVLLHLVKNYNKNCNNSKIKIYPLIVDHKLRIESSDEANKVKLLAENLGFETVIKKIENNKPTGNIQNWARNKRRNLLFQRCVDLSANLLLAHHSDDQAETLFMRFAKKSGLDGLSGMKSLTYWNSIFILRPLLTFSKKQIVTYANKNYIKFFEDPSNKFYKYERVRTRYYLKTIKLNEWNNISKDLNRFSTIANKLTRTVNHLFASWTKKNILIDKSGVVRLEYEGFIKLLEKSNLFSINTLGKIIQTVGGKEYPPKRRKMHSLVKFLLSSQFKNHTLGNVRITLKKKYIFFIREQRNLKINLDVKKNKKYIFDGRFLLISNITGSLIISADGNNSDISEGSPFYAFKKVINNSIPCIQTLEGKRIKPHLSIIDKETKSYESFEPNSFRLCLINRVSI